MIPLREDPSFCSFHVIVNQSTRHPTRRHSLRCYRIRRHHTSRLTRHHTRRALRAIVLTADIPIDIVLVTSYCTTSHCRCHSQSYTNHLAKLAMNSSRFPCHHTRRCVRAIVLSADILIDVYSSRLFRQLPFVSDMCSAMLPTS
jgi:hypothetical protein